jgi:predicted transposase YdaD
MECSGTSQPEGAFMNSRRNDASYKLLFAHAELVVDLLLGFMPAPLVNHMDLSSLRPLSGNLVTQRLTQLHADQVWQVNLKDSDRFCLIHIEFQRSFDDLMPLRMLGYCAQLLQACVARQKLEHRRPWPPLLSIVLYNGQTQWRGSTQFKGHFKPLASPLRTCMPQHRFFLVDIHRQDVRRLVKLDNVLAWLMRFEIKPSISEVAETLWHLKQKLSAQHDLRRTIGIWALEAAGHLERMANLIDAFVDPKESAMNFKQKFEHSIQELQNISHAQGVTQGLTQGLTEGRQAVLIRLLSKRFGVLQPVVMQRLESASGEQLDAWAENLLDAQTLRDVFKPSH